MQNEGARVAELADALDSGSSGVFPVQVQILPRAPNFLFFTDNDMHSTNSPESSAAPPDDPHTTHTHAPAHTHATTA